MRSLTTDYLVVDVGAMGMAFTDALIDHADGHVTLFDRRHPGGHWQHAFPSSIKPRHVPGVGPDGGNVVALVDDDHPVAGGHRGDIVTTGMGLERRSVDDAPGLVTSAPTLAGLHVE